ncbi:hypothetical protein O181_044460 [Austropuccinia psidii MF-1]|uniref:Reverse transcriptase Ty1/copia-type domain-containing protein n=1 Tax=Austropuccinia psidii MF-1 TaxID=1389203 RepID=A0A9Q3HK65_9BASI|nr:hypothetical protein [Austropuccinia psidii MF-1]
MLDSFVFYRGGTYHIGIYIHVDDLALFGPHLDPSKEEIQKKFNMKDLGKEDLPIRIKILHNKARFSLSQDNYIENIAENFNVINLAPTNTPLKPGLQLMKASEDEVRAFEKLELN